MKRLSKTFYLASIGGSGIIGLLLIAAAIGAMYVSQARQEASDGGPLLAASLFLFCGGVAAVIYATVMFCRLIYFAWRSIQDGHARTTPGNAVGLLFIPVYNIYWNFQALWGFAMDYNAYIKRHGLDLASLPRPLFFALCVCQAVVAVMPVGMIGLVFGVATFVLLIAAAAKMIDAVNGIAGTSERAGPAIAGEA